MENFYFGCAKTLSILSKHGHTIRSVIVFVLASHGVGAKHINEFSVFAVFLIQRLIPEEAMLFNPRRIDDDLSFLIGSGVLGSDVGRLCSFLPQPILKER